MKKTFVLLLILMLIPSVFADRIDVYRFKVFANNVNQEIDWDDDEFDIMPDTTVELQIRFENNDNQTIEVDIEGTLFEIGDDITRSDTIDIEEDEKQTVVFEYFIPSDTREDIYDLEIKYEYEFYDYDINETVVRDEKKTFEVDVRKERQKEEDILTNLTRHLSDEKERTNQLLEVIIDSSNITTAYAECKDQLTGELLNGEYKNKYETELNQKQNCEVKKVECESQKANMYSQSEMESKLSEEVRSAKLEQKSKDDWQTIIVAGLILGYNFWKKKKETVGGQGEGKSLMGAKWK